jgi:DNA topoisomerase-2
LPIGVWTNKYKDQVEDWYEAKQISGRANYSTVDTVSFVLSPSEIEESDKGLKLVSYVSMANMVAFNGEKEITRYEDVHAIMEEYCAKRMALYVRRKAHGISVLEAEIERERDKVRFLEDVMGGQLVIFQRPEEEVEAELDRRGYHRIEGYSYLLQLPIRSFTREKVDELKERQRRAEEAHRKLAANEPRAIWESELEALMPYL